MPDATASALLAAEARALAAFRKTVGLFPGKPRAAAPLLVAAVAASRAYARSVGAVDMAHEARIRLPSLPDIRDLDQRYAVRAVTGYLKALDVLDEKREAGESVRVLAAVDAKLELIAATEIPGAFSEERERIETQYVRDNPTLVPVLLKLWNARLDGACPVCRALHRTSRPWGVDFNGGKEPGRAHPRCRCFTTYMPIPITVVGPQRKQQRRRLGAWEWAS